MPQEHQSLSDSIGVSVNDSARPIELTEVFRALIKEELRHGKLTPLRRRRIIQYAAAMGLSAAQTGALIEQCRREALENGSPEIRRQDLRLVHPEPPIVPAGIKLALAAGIAVILNLLLLNVLQSGW